MAIYFGDYITFEKQRRLETNPRISNTAFAAVMLANTKEWTESIEFKHMEGSCADIHDLDFTDQIATQSQTGSASDWI